MQQETIPFNERDDKVDMFSLHSSMVISEYLCVNLCIHKCFPISPVFIPMITRGNLYVTLCITASVNEPIK